jgi:choline dehydrogenase
MYDYVIVGAGSAGCVLANRLSADPAVSVLLLEAGGPDTRMEIAVPAAFPTLFRTDCDWAYETVAQPRLGGRRLYWPRGKVLGGSSSINAMIYIRGHRVDYDGWAGLGNKGWSYADVLPYFKRAENQERGADDYHGVGGPLHVADLRHVNPVSRAFVDACAELGLPRNPDFNGAEQAGAGFYQVTQARGARCSAAAAYVRPVARRRNLVVRTGVHVTRLRVAGGRVTGVECVRERVRDVVGAGREVLLCAGAVGSPQILLLSGIGPGAHLRELGIGVVRDLPGVGQNLQDHLAVGAVFACTRPVTLMRARSSRVELLRYLLGRRGMLTSNIAEAGGFTGTQPGLSAPDLQLHFAPAYFIDHGFGNPEGHGFTIAPTLIRPRSRGAITLASRDPFEPPRIEPNCLADAADLRVLVEGVRLARRIARATPLARFCGEEVSPGGDDGGTLAAGIARRTETLYHPAGTCRMGADPMAVVDAGLQVHGLSGLRVVDASVMPVIVGGNTNAPTIMIAERAADLIRGGA